MLFISALCPHLGRCLENAVTTEVDVELGRCVHAYLGIECTQVGDPSFPFLAQDLPNVCRLGCIVFLEIRLELRRHSQNI